MSKPRVRVAVVCNANEMRCIYYYRKRKETKRHEIMPNPANIQTQNQLLALVTFIYLLRCDLTNQDSFVKIAKLFFFVCFSSYFLGRVSVFFSFFKGIMELAYLCQQVQINVLETRISFVFQMVLWTLYSKYWYRIRLWDIIQASSKVRHLIAYKFICFTRR